MKYCDLLTPLVKKVNFSIILNYANVNIMLISLLLTQCWNLCCVVGSVYNTSVFQPD